MKLFKKEKKQNSVIYTIFGFKIKKTSFIKKYFDDIYMNYNHNWRFYGVTEDLIKSLSFKSQCIQNWKNFDSRIWIIYLSCLIEVGNYEKALAILKKYYFYHKLKRLEKAFVVADFAFKNGICNENIKHSSCIYNKILASRENSVLKNYLENKTIAIVGNGPSEKGKARGEEIDKHDIVIRFNNFETKGFEKDYGKKTDIWCCNLNSDILNRDLKNINMVLVPENIKTRFVAKPEILYKAICENKIICDFDESLTFKLMSEYYDQPTFGLRLIYGLSKILDNFDKIDFYGFNFCADIQAKTTVHYFKNRNAEFEVLHNLTEETKFLVKLIKSKKGGE